MKKPRITTRSAKTGAAIRRLIARIQALVFSRGSGAPRSSPSVLRSSSTSGQCIPYPAPANSQLFRWEGVAFRSLGYQERGTLILRPSRRDTQSESSVKLTSATHSPGLGAEVLIPCLQERLPVLLHYGLYPTKFDGAKPKVLGQRDGHKPELCRFRVSVHVDVGRLMRFMTVKIESVRPRSEHGWHADILKLI